MDNLPVLSRRPSFPIDLSPVRVAPVIEGEIVSDGVIHELCGEYHEYVADNDEIICCSCGHCHYADSICLGSGPCGDYRCCIN